MNVVMISSIMEMSMKKTMCIYKWENERETCGEGGKESIRFSGGGNILQLIKTIVPSYGWYRL